uniref:Uncharacterized protein n=1 Tax=Arundo donax TaxID=35708 RepID=A0A0A9DPV3_ARUDO
MVDPIPSMLRKLFDFTNRLLPSAAASVFENVATWLGSPTSWRPCRQASALFTRILAAHAQEVGGFHTMPAITTSSSKAPAGLSWYRARNMPPSV